jgi:hypothetical protein
VERLVENKQGVNDRILRDDPDLTDTWLQKKLQNSLSECYEGEREAFSEYRCHTLRDPFKPPLPCTELE